MIKIVAKIQRNRIFKFLSSVKMAVIVMLILGVVVAFGTVYESRYNAQVAGIMVYKTPWFLLLLALLWLNIFLAAVSRIPFRRRHTGFVVTHVGMLTLLIGSGITFLYGIDGQLAVQEGGKSRTVELSDLAIKVIREGSDEVHVFPFPRTLGKKAVRMEDFSALTGLSVQEYLPAAERRGVGGNGQAGAGFLLGFGMQSQFFNVSEKLHSTEKPEMQMGPARIRILEVSGSDEAKAQQTGTKQSKKTKSLNGPTITILDSKSGAILEEIPLKRLSASGKTLRGVKIEVAKEYASAVVSSNRLAAGGTGNPAVELRLTKGSDSMREVAFQKFPTFSLSPEGFFGLRFRLSGYTEVNSQHGEARAEQTERNIGGSSNLDRTGNVIEFHVDRSNLNAAVLQLHKNNEKILEKAMKVGETATTPWMGMKITFSDLSWSPGNEADSASEVAPLEIPMRSPLPQSAVRIAGQWLLEGEARRVANGNERFEIFYGQNSIDIPFDINLHKFEKVDYIGTETAMSFQSLVSANDEAEKTLIKMNEPLERDGFIVYQSSYQLAPGQKPISVFSVNRDPGRLTKYLGAVILVIGIFLFIVMRSKWYLGRYAGVSK